MVCEFFPSLLPMLFSISYFADELNAWSDEQMRAGNKARSKWMPLMDLFLTDGSKKYEMNAGYVFDILWELSSPFFRFQWHGLSFVKCTKLTTSPIHHSPPLLLSYSRYKIKVEIFIIFFSLLFLLVDSTNYNIFNSCIAQQKTLNVFGKNEWVVVI